MARKSLLIAKREQSSRSKLTAGRTLANFSGETLINLGWFLCSPNLSLSPRSHLHRGFVK